MAQNYLTPGYILCVGMTTMISRSRVGNVHSE